MRLLDETTVNLWVGALERRSGGLAALYADRARRAGVGGSPG